LNKRQFESVSWQKIGNDIRSVLIFKSSIVVAHFWREAHARTRGNYLMEKTIFEDIVLAFLFYVSILNYFDLCFQFEHYKCDSSSNIDFGSFWYVQFYVFVVLLLS
jgi:hypothetical protein